METKKKRRFFYSATYTILCTIVRFKTNCIEIYVYRYLHLIYDQQIILLLPRIFVADNPHANAGTLRSTV